ncbi:MAG: hypothetical protein KC493_10300 [Bacteriovoracaceae bacterium]|nr:hypothetical protein [Bacteriovoracaceae bacterium]
MSKRPFQANSWLVSSTQNKSSEHQDASGFSDHFGGAASANAGFSPNGFLVPGWKGEGLISKQAINLKNSLRLLKEDAKIQFQRLYSNNRSLKMAIYNEFISYAETHSIHLHKVDNLNEFWKHLISENSPFASDLNQFVDAYCFRAVTIYLFKSRFILTLGQEIGEPIHEKTLMNPTSFFQRVFKRGSSKELRCTSLQTNPYSWYRPSSECLDTISSLSRDLLHIGTTELMKICSQDTSLKREEDKLDFSDTDYSHSLSHLEFGLFLNQLMIRFPHWLKSQNLKKGTKLPVDQLEILNTKFCGNQLASLSLSHWLAQDNNSYTQWSQILCPEFQGESFKHGEFLKICHELHFLNFLCSLSERQQHNPIELICNVMKNKYSNSRSSSEQISIFENSVETKELVYNRIVLNLNKLPKNNPHHYLLGRITQQLDQLDQDGFLLVFSNQKFFIPSKTDKIEQLLNSASLDAHFNLEGLNGKGEIPNYLYIFSKRSLKKKNSFAMNEVLMGPVFDKNQKDSTVSIRWEGDLTQFTKFGEFVRELEGLQKTKSMTETPIYQRDLGDGMCFEFHQDAIFEGKLLSATNKDPAQVTHPNFFRNLTKACLPLDQFFQIETLQPEQEKSQLSSTQGLLGIRVKPEDRFPFVLIVDHRNPANIKLEVCSSEAYRAKFEENGYAYFQYFGMLPKISPININIFREYFKTNIGQQVIQLSLHGGLSKTKAKLSSLLVPRFFESANELPPHVSQALSFLEMDTQNILSSHPDDIEQGFETSKQTLISLSARHPWQTMSRLSWFKYNIEECLKEFRNNKPGRQKVDYSNPLVKTPLLKLQTTSVLPKNEDVYVEFKAKTPDQIHLEATRVVLSTDTDNPSLTILCGEVEVVCLYSEPVLLDFINFIVNHHIGMSVSSILHNLHVPRISELKNVLENYNKLESSLSSILVQTRMIIGNLITQQISNSRLL